MKSHLIGKDFDAEKDWKQEEKGTKKDEMVGWHHQLNGPNKFQEMVKGEEIWHAAVHGIGRVRYDLAAEQHNMETATKERDPC